MSGKQILDSGIGTGVSGLGSRGPSSLKIKVSGLGLLGVSSLGIKVSDVGVGRV